MTVLLAETSRAGDNNGLYLIFSLVGALVLTWPIYRRLLRWLGTLFLAFGIALAMAALGDAPRDGHAIGLVVRR